ncbi:NAD(P)-binding protein [Exidia glandulosa HHB12029]|uniref:NAD(P)-binding protein n=1 Tax=Exidia glandulosa HHB12029 TaxID=1314781 RepID=A0A165D5C3_EXIGL|nr:NAD(P)-binding protein [Exidia glandulosa HHB12029]
MSPPVYLITGVSRGIGLEWLDDLTRTVPDAVVIGVARNPEKAPKLQELASSRKNLHVVKGDVTSTESVEHIIAETKKFGGGKLDYLINNAAVLGDRLSIFDVPLEDYASVFDINVTGTIRITLAALPLLRAGSKKVIFNVSSFVGSNAWLLSQPDAIPTAPYCVSKAALNMFNSTLAKEVEKEGIIAVSVSPGYVATDMNKGATGTISVQESVTAQKTILHKLTTSDNGKFYSHDGDVIPF